jgi:hypothetical protein
MVGNRKTNPRLLKGMRAYSFQEVSEILGCHLQTVRRWHKGGLKVLDDGTKPFLVMGKDVREFLKAKSKGRKHPLKPGELFCPRCRLPRESLPENLTVETTERRLGKSDRQVVIRGVCVICGQRMILFSSTRKVGQMIGTKSQPPPALNGGEAGSVNDQIKGGIQG